ncbi:MAG: hypothetical protein IRZ05_03400 [Micromonosporaceae bacterium]|jgi:hypothetical protein|nr:hypothetical protein [Micromonosporaceae bacterium]
MGVTREIYCATCATVAPFEPCSGDGDDSPEWACTRCGEAIVLAPLTLVGTPSRRARQVPPGRPDAAAA